MIDFRAQTDALKSELIARRRDFHQHPELAFEEFRTANIVAQELSQLGMEVQTGVGRTGVVGLLEGRYDGPTVLVRADMDALPIVEETGLEYASATVGKMHACGHDGHTAIALGVARLLTDQRERMAGRVKFVFQPAEETAQGAKAMIADGVLEKPRPDVSLGLHLWNSLPLGTVAMTDGPVMAGSSEFTIRISGKGGHAAAPHQARDPVVCAAQIIVLLQTVISRSADPFETGVISVTKMRAGEAFNVIPEVVELSGTLRYFRREMRELLCRRMVEIVEHTCAALECTGSTLIDHQTEVVVNDKRIGERLRSRFSEVAGVMVIDTNMRTMGAEDMSFLMSDVPGLYFFVGAADPTADVYYGHHHPRFTITEDALVLGTTLLASAVAAYVLPDDHA